MEMNQAPLCFFCERPPIALDVAQQDDGLFTFHRDR